MSAKTPYFAGFAGRQRPDAAQLLRATVGRDGNKLRRLLGSKTSTELSTQDIRSDVEGNLWMLAPEAFRYFLPAFLHAALDSYSTISVFVSELVGALTEPSRGDVEDALARLAQPPGGPALPDEMNDLLSRQQREWFDSGTPSALFRERVDGLTPAEGAAVLAFFEELAAAHGADYPFDELEQAVQRHWARYRAS